MSTFKYFPDNELEVTVFGFSNGNSFSETSHIKKDSLPNFLKTIHPDFEVVAHDNNFQKIYSGFGQAPEMKTGDYAKLLFGVRFPERMWVKITEINGDRVTGLLQNSPIGDTFLQWGDKVHFNKSEIMEIRSDRSFS